VASFVLLLLVTLSVPIIKNIYLFKIYVDVESVVWWKQKNGASTVLMIRVFSQPIYEYSSLNDLISTGEIRTGVLGYCSTGIASVSVDALSSLGTQVVGPVGCTPRRLGYDIPNSLVDALNEVPGINISNINSAIIKKLTYVLVLFIIG
jgi:hypothetical protein